MKLNEKTFELNLTKEILDVADFFSSLLWLSFPITKLYMHLSGASPSLKPPYALGIPLTEEKNKGWDVKVIIPSLGLYKPRAVFFQFKSGYHINYSSKKGSIFQGTKKYKSPHVLFHI
ncbi:hypothetical protein, partial [Aneurinibacillus danicus]|uniref:hypothetical protein n=1 Tax=Aneurinibacillus danicus TaxID=267746 RepID=UPI0011BE5797